MGFLWTTIAVVLWAAWAFLTVRSVVRIGSVWSGVVVSFLSLPLTIWLTLVTPLPDRYRDLLWAVAAAGAAVAAQVAYTLAVRNVSRTVIPVAVALYPLPVLTLMALLGEGALTARQWVGAFVTVGGVVILLWPR